MKDVIYVFAFFGLIALLAVVALFLVWAKECIEDTISIAKWKYTYKHRFDKAPTAKCYCKDCKHYCRSTNSCCMFDDRKMAEEWFCWRAEPTKYDKDNPKH